MSPSSDPDDVSTTGSPGTTDGGTTEKETPDWDVSKISAGASVVQQPTEDDPPTVELWLTSSHDGSVILVPDGPDEMLYYVPPMEGDSANVVLIPEETSSPDLPDARIDGCWRLDVESPEEASVPVVRPESIPFELGPKERYEVRHEVYHAIGSGTCYPDGEYTAEKTLQFTENEEVGVNAEREGPSFTLQYTLTADDEGSIAIEVDGPDPA